MYVEGTILYDRSESPSAYDIADVFNKNTQLTGIDVENRMSYVWDFRCAIREGLVTLVVRNGIVPSSWLTDPALREVAISGLAPLTYSHTITKLTLFDWSRDIPLSWHFPRLRQCIVNDQKTRPHIYVPSTGRIEESWSLDMYTHCYKNRAADKARRTLWLVCKRYNLPRDLRRLLCMWWPFEDDWPLPDQWRKKDGRYAFVTPSDNLQKQWTVQRKMQRIADDIWWKEADVEIATEKLQKARKRHKTVTDELKEYKAAYKKTRRKLKKGLSHVFY